MSRPGSTPAQSRCPMSGPKVSFEPAALKENLQALINDLQKAKPAAAKGQYLKSVYLAPTMGPSVPVDPAAEVTEAVRPRPEGPPSGRPAGSTRIPPLSTWAMSLAQESRGRAGAPRG